MESYEKLEAQKESIEERMDLDAIDRVAARMYQVSADHGFHDGEVKGFQAAIVERIAIFIANLHGECSELWEAARKDALYETCDKGINLTNAEEELADIVIRAMDTAHTLGIKIGDAIAKKTAYNKLRPHKHGKKC
jgi:NTP pyrophosphatase (non-canonical NTP hydrolase)